MWQYSDNLDTKEHKFKHILCKKKYKKKKIQKNKNKNSMKLTPFV